MRTNAITRIIIFSIVIVILLGILLTGLGIGMFMTNLDHHSSYTTTQGETAVFSPEEIKKIQIDWASGDIHIESGNVDAIEITESGSFSPQEAMAIKHSGDTLYIRFKKEVIKFDSFNIENKDLTVTVPKGWNCKDLTMDVASADVTVQSFTADDVTLNTASGDYVFRNCTVSDLDVNTASGSIEYAGSLNTLDCDAASGRFTGVFTNTPSAIHMDSVSGDMDITLPSDSGFRVDVEALSGQFHTDFPTSRSGDSYVCGDGACEIEFDGISGNIRLYMGS